VIASFKNGLFMDSPSRSSYSFAVVNFQLQPDYFRGIKILCKLSEFLSSILTLPKNSLATAVMENERLVVIQTPTVVAPTLTPAITEHPHMVISSLRAMAIALSELEIVLPHVLEHPNPP